MGRQVAKMVSQAFVRLRKVVLAVAISTFTKSLSSTTAGDVLPHKDRSTDTTTTVAQIAPKDAMH
jgi:hypothetical protein